MVVGRARLLVHARVVWGKRTLPDGRRRAETESAFLEPERDRGLDRPAPGHRLLPRRPRPFRDPSRRRHGRFPDVILRQISKICRAASLHFRRKLRRPLRPCDLGARHRRVPQVPRRRDRQRAHGSRRAISVLRPVRGAARPRLEAGDGHDEDRRKTLRTTHQSVREASRRRRRPRGDVGGVSERLSLLQSRRSHSRAIHRCQRLRRPHGLRRQSPLLRLLGRRRLPEPRRRPASPGRQEDLAGVLQARRHRHGLRRGLGEDVLPGRQGPARPRQERPDLRRRVRLHL
mmetsp:Transcript_15079/g.45664  ORF Transcript_15079/g.45664 Transcript_15079/m.45664 type:complete len:288 (+) Transcript_15079:227-1090(+)